MDAAASKMDEAEQRISDIQDRFIENKEEEEKRGRLRQKSMIKELQISVTP